MNVRIMYYKCLCIATLLHQAAVSICLVCMFHNVRYGYVNRVSGLWFCQWVTQGMLMSAWNFYWV